MSDSDIYFVKNDYFIFEIYSLTINLFKLKL